MGPANLRSLPARWRAWLSATAPLWARFPEVLAVGQRLCFPIPPNQSLLSVAAGIPRSLRGLLGFLLRVRPLPPLDARHDVLLCCHSVTANARAPVLALADRLRRDGTACLVWTPDGANPEAGGPAGEEFDRLMVHPWSRLLALGLLARSALAALLVGTVLLGGKWELIDLCLDPFRLWHELARSAHRIRAARLVLERGGVRLILVTHERFPPAAEFLPAARAAGLATLLYHHAAPSIYDLPVLSDEVLVWNDTDAGVLAGLCSGPGTPRLTIAGNAEVDLVLDGTLGAGDADQAGGPWRRAAADRPVLLFLSQYLAADPVMAEATAGCVGWISRAAERCPSWFFLVKERDYDDEIRKLMRRSGALERENVGVVSREASYAALLRREEILAVAAFCSAGLFVAAGCGKRTLRLLPVPLHYEDTVQDRVVEDVRSPEDLVRRLEEPRAGAPAETDRTDLEFPFRGRTLERIQEICLRRLEGRPA